MKNCLACVASCAQMIDGIFKLHPQRPRHSSRMPGTIANVKCLDFTPFAFLLGEDDTRNSLSGLRYLTIGQLQPASNCGHHSSRSNLMDHAPFAHGFYADRYRLGFWHWLYLRTRWRSLPDYELAQRYRKRSRERHLSLEDARNAGHDHHILSRAESCRSLATRALEAVS
jgi:hypothetical protein